jgi:hypothetical protein
MKNKHPAGELKRTGRCRNVPHNYIVIHYSRQMRMGYGSAVYHRGRRRSMCFIGRLAGPINMDHLYFYRLARSKRHLTGTDLAIIPNWKRKHYRMGQIPSICYRCRYRPCCLLYPVNLFIFLLRNRLVLRS